MKKPRKEVNLELVLTMRFNMAKKAYHHVTRDLRCQIATLKSIGYTQRKIALETGLDQSTISREIARNSKDYRYSAPEADYACTNRRSKAVRVPKKLKGNLELKIRKCIEEDWSPEQISGRLKLEQEQVVVSHETIYVVKWDGLTPSSLDEHFSIIHTWITGKAHIVCMILNIT
ncbi:hypothetical protein FACS189472_07610 [Alphaproteobacteria bacterium]|nr:hypothetical protein FACS189472_07610 [Alphaproteobacteria bacterium]